MTFFLGTEGVSNRLASIPQRRTERVVETLEEKGSETPYL
jgi:hypothetical protein